jgi:hypothetical protein
VPISADGEHLLGNDFAGFAGAENEEGGTNFEYGATYEFSRTSSGWKTESLEPPTSLAARRWFRGASADLSRSLWYLDVQQNEGEEVASSNVPFNLAIREAVPGGGARFTQVGPADAPGQTAFGFQHELGGPPADALEGETGWGASQNLTHIVLGDISEHGQLWSGDTTRAGDPSLYEYSGTGNREPSLVGVSGPLEGKSYINEGAKLISECGTLLGDGEGAVGGVYDADGDAYNAISESGAIVYFTALHGDCATPTVNELYARIGGTETVAISEPTAADCSACNITTGLQNAVFQGASESGEKVFFLTDQELLTGQQGMNLYEYDFNGAEHAKVSLVSGGEGSTEPRVQGVVRVSESGERVYFVAKGVLATNSNGQPADYNPQAQVGADNLYVYEPDPGHPGQHRTVFIAMLCSGHEESGEVTDTKCQSGTSDEKDWQLQDERPAQTSADGEYLLFESRSDLTEGDTSSVAQVFEYDTVDERLARVSIGACPASMAACGASERFNDNGNTTETADAPSIHAPNYVDDFVPTEAASGLSVAETGVVVFSSADALSPGAVQGRENIYEYRDGSLYLISAEDAVAPLERPSRPRFLGMSPSGRDVFFFTADSLVPQDTDTQANWYDAREGGGFPAPVSPAGCMGDACQGALSTPPFLPAQGGSATTPGGGNLAAPVSKPTVVKPKALTRAQKLAKALRACTKEPKKQRAACVKQARKRYVRTTKAAKSDRSGK